MNLQNKIPKHVREPNTMKEPTKSTIESKFDS